METVDANGNTLRVGDKVKLVKPEFFSFYTHRHLETTITAIRRDEWEEFDEVEVAQDRGDYWWHKHWVKVDQLTTEDILSNYGIE